MELKNLKESILDHKFALLVGVLLIIFGLGSAALIFNSVTSGLGDFQQSADANYEPLDKSRALESDAGSSGFLPPVGDEEVSGSYVEVQEGDIEISSEDIENDISSIRNLTEGFDGYVEESRKTEGSLYTNADLTVRVPSDDFQEFIDRINQDYNVESYDVENYRVSTQREIDELTVLNRSMEDYEKIREEVNKMENDEKKLELLMKVTDRQLELQEKRKRYQRDLSDKQQRGNMATVDINLKEERKVDIWPDNIENRFKDELSQMLDTVVDTVITTFTGGVVLLFKSVKYLVYIGILLLPLGLAYKLGRRLYSRYS